MFLTNNSPTQITKTHTKCCFLTAMVSKWCTSIGVEKEGAQKNAKTK